MVDMISVNLEMNDLIVFKRNEDVDILVNIYEDVLTLVVFIHLVNLVVVS